MDSDLWWGLVALLVLIAFTAGSSAVRAAWPRLNRGRLKHLAAEGVASARAALALAEEPGATGTALTVANTTGLVLVAGLGIYLDLRYVDGNSLIQYGAAALGFVVVLWVQVAAHTVGKLYPDSAVMLLLGPLRITNLLLMPLTSALCWLTRVVVPVDASQVLAPSIVEEDLRMIVETVEGQGALEQGERAMINSIFEMGETTAREIMVPRVDVAAVEASEPLRTVLERINSRGHSRIPVYEENIDNIVGVVYAKDLLSYMDGGSLDDPARVLARPPHFIPESKKTDELLREMQQNKVHMAVVLDEYGGTAGIVTIEDLLEEIVGDIQDEYDAEEISIERLSESEAVFDARVSIRDVNETLDASLEEDGEYDTIGGLVYDRLGKIPVVGDEVRVNGLWLTVLSTLGKRIKKVKIKVEPDPADERSPGV